jgi:hypothetical protein
LPFLRQNSNAKLGRWDAPHTHTHTLTHTQNNWLAVVVLKPLWVVVGWLWFVCCISAISGFAAACLYEWKGGVLKFLTNMATSKVDSGDSSSPKLQPEYSSSTGLSVAEGEEVNHEKGNILSLLLLTNFNALFRLGASRQLEMSGMWLVLIWLAMMCDACMFVALQILASLKSPSELMRSAPSSKWPGRKNLLFRTRSRCLCGEHCAKSLESGA